MSTPSTKRDQRRDSRRQQLQQQQAERRRAREAALRKQRLWRIGMAVGAVLVLGLLIWGGVAWYAAAHGPQSYNQPASGSQVDGISCMSMEGQVEHYHMDLNIYMFGRAEALPAGVGIVEPSGTDTSQYPALAVGSPACLYFLHTHDSTGIVHIESPVANHVYKLGNFYDIWGQPLSTTNFMGNPVNASNKLQIVMYDANGKKSIYTGNPYDIPLTAHETVYLLYDSPNVTTTAYTAWNGL